MSVRVVTEVEALRQAVSAARAGGARIGLVPTMGALHAGHLSLVTAARRECDFTVATIFVNPTQFGPNEDFGRYPRMLDADVEALGTVGTNLVFAPSTETVYRAGHATYVEPGGVALRWEGEFRPGHFRGVATIVLKLFNLVGADRAYFGRKDYQQARVIQQMVADLDLPIAIEVCPTVRDPDGLAMSSRNAYLSSDERRRALSISASLRRAKELVAAGAKDASSLIANISEQLRSADLKIDYVAIADRETLEPLAAVDRPAVALIAARVGSTRLIDNELLP